MTRQANARLAGAAFLLYIAVGITSMVIGSGSTAGANATERLQSIAQNSDVVTLNMMLGVFTGFIALALGVALYGFTREEDHELALLGLTCRVGEALSVMVPTLATLGLLWLSTGELSTDAAAPAIAALLFNVKAWNVTLAATFFAVGSMIFSWLMLRGRLIPRWMAWLGVFASALLLIGLPLQMADIISGVMVQLMWVPMAAFEIPLGVWLLWSGGRTRNAL
jgi:hypothetical protein